MWTKLRQSRKMSVRQTMIELAFKPGFGEQARFFKQVADVANISKTAARYLWRQGHLFSDDHRDVRAVREAAERKQGERERGLRDEIREVRARLQRLESVLLTQDEEFHRETLNALRGQVAGLGGMDRTKS